MESYYTEMSCKGLCNRYQAPPKRIGQSPIRPDEDIRWCQVCHVILQWSGGIIRKYWKKETAFLTKFYCPCCGYKLRSAPRHKEKLWKRLANVSYNDKRM